MVTFTFGDRKAEMFLQCDPFETTAYLRWGVRGYGKIVSGEDAVYFLSEMWRCELDEIKHDLPNEITTPEQELDFAMFYNGQPMCIYESGAMPKLVWCGWTYKSNSSESWESSRYVAHKSWNEPLWRDVITKVEFEARPEYYAEAIKRIMAGDHKKYKGRIADDCTLGDRDGKSYVYVRIWANHLTRFRIVRGERKDGIFHVSDLTDEVLTCRIPIPDAAERAFEIVEEEKNKAILNMMDKFFPTGTDVAEIRDYRNSILYGVKSIPSAKSKYEIFWTSSNGNTALLVRIPISGDIRCPEQFKGNLIGHKGGTIRPLGQKHGFRRLNII